MPDLDVFTGSWICDQLADLIERGRALRPEVAHINRQQFQRNEAGQISGACAIGFTLLSAPPNTPCNLVTEGLLKAYEADDLRGVEHLSDYDWTVSNPTAKAGGFQ